jgi:hypothetical protein
MLCGYTRAVQAGGQVMGIGTKDPKVEELEKILQKKP